MDEDNNGILTHLTLDNATPEMLNDKRYWKRQEDISNFEKYEFAPEHLRPFINDFVSIGPVLGYKSNNEVESNITRCKLRRRVIIIPMTDGIFDNLSDRQIYEALVTRIYTPDQPQESIIFKNYPDPQKAAEHLVERATYMASKTYYGDIKYVKAKRDDTTVIVIYYNGEQTP